VRDARKDRCRRALVELSNWPRPTIKIGSQVTALGSNDGSMVMVGTGTGRILALDSASGAVSEFVLPDAATGIVSR
jgi:hypothetical protein